jgi:hypothetical protein
MLSDYEIHGGCYLGAATHLCGRVLWCRAPSHDGQDVAAKQHLHNADAAIIESSTKLQGSIHICLIQAWSTAVPVIPCAPRVCPALLGQHFQLLRLPLTVSLKGSQLYTLNPFVVPHAKQP